MVKKWTKLTSVGDYFIITTTLHYNNNSMVISLKENKAMLSDFKIINKPATLYMDD